MTDAYDVPLWNLVKGAGLVSRSCCYLVATPISGVAAFLKRQDDADLMNAIIFERIYQNESSYNPLSSTDTRRFSALPLVVELLATGWKGPYQFNTKRSLPRPKLDFR